MPRPPNVVPTYRLHRQSGQAVVSLRLANGGRRDVLLGPHGSTESQAEYARVLAEWRATRGRAGPVAGLTVNQVLAAYWQHAEGYYRGADGESTNELVEIRYALKPVKALYGHTPADGFGPLGLKAVRDNMIAAGWCRNRVNKQVGRVKRAFRWAVGEEMIPPAVYHGLAAVTGLAKGRSTARESELVKPVPEAHVEAVLPHLPPTVATMVRLQLLTGMRPGEICIIRGCDLDVSGDVWTFRPQRHKNDWRGQNRAICLGPRAQAVLKTFLQLDMRAYLFNPKTAEADRGGERRRSRRTPLWPSHQRRYDRDRARRGRRPLGDHYTPASYNRAIARACVEADVPSWSANRLRHNHAMEVRRRFGLEAAGAALGHTKMSATQIYAERDCTLARRVAAEIG
jgi:integrase